MGRRSPAKRLTTDSSPVRVIHQASFAPELAKSHNFSLNAGQSDAFSDMDRSLGETTLLFARHRGPAHFSLYSDEKLLGPTPAAIVKLDEQVPELPYRQTANSFSSEVPGR